MAPPTPSGDVPTASRTTERMPPDVIAVTPRLVLRRLDAVRDAAFILRLHTSPTWIKHICPMPTVDLDTAANYIRNRPLRMYEEANCGSWLVIRRRVVSDTNATATVQPAVGESFVAWGRDAAPTAASLAADAAIAAATEEPVRHEDSIGICGLILRPELCGLFDAGFAFLPEAEGQGYAFEASGVTLRYAREVLRCDELTAITSPTNVRSQSLLKRLGFDHKDGDTLDAGGHNGDLVFRLRFGGAASRVGVESESVQ